MADADVADIAIAVAASQLDLRQRLVPDDLHQCINHTIGSIDVVFRHGLEGLFRVTMGTLLQRSSAYNCTDSFVPTIYSRPCEVLVGCTSISQFEHEQGYGFESKKH